MHSYLWVHLLHLKCVGCKWVYWQMQMTWVPPAESTSVRFRVPLCDTCFCLTQAGGYAKWEHSFSALCWRRPVSKPHVLCASSKRCTSCYIKNILLKRPFFIRLADELLLYKLCNRALQLIFSWKSQDSLQCTLRWKKVVGQKIKPDLEDWSQKVLLCLL